MYVKVYNIKRTYNEDEDADAEEALLEKDDVECSSAAPKSINWASGSAGRLFPPSLSLYRGGRSKREGGARESSGTGGCSIPASRSGECVVKMAGRKNRYPRLERCLLGRKGVRGASSGIGCANAATRFRTRRKVSTKGDERPAS